MLAISLDEARTIGIVVAVALVVAAVASFWVMKSVVQKLAGATLLLLLAFAVWTQRGALEDCADKVQASYERAGADVTINDTDCSFFGITITISDPRN